MKAAPVPASCSIPPNPSRSRPCPTPPAFDVHLFSQADDTPAETQAMWAGLLVGLLRGKAMIQAALDSDTRLDSLRYELGLLFGGGKVLEDLA